MSKHDYIDWYQKKFDDNAIAYAEKHEDDFEEFCFNKWTQEGTDYYDCE